jgi:hypothetical protein
MEEYVHALEITFSDEDRAALDASSRSAPTSANTTEPTSVRTPTGRSATGNCSASCEHSWFCSFFLASSRYPAIRSTHPAGKRAVDAAPAPCATICRMFAARLGKMQGGLRRSPDSIQIES